MSEEKQHGYVVKTPDGRFETFTAALNEKNSIRLMEDETSQDWSHLQRLRYSCIPFHFKELKRHEDQHKPES